MKEHNCIEELGKRLMIGEQPEFSHITFNFGADVALRINQDLSVTLNPNVHHDDIVKAVFEPVSRLIQKQIEDEVQKRLKGRTKTCFLVYRVAPEYREMIGIYSTEEKAKEFITTMERFVRDLISYEYEEWPIE